MMRMITLIMKGLGWFIVSMGKVIGGIVLLIATSGNEDEDE